MGNPIRTIHLIHHSHTDIGYTELQGRIARWHVDFINQALDIIDEIPSFKWQCECFWQVEQFLAGASSLDRGRFDKAVQENSIGLSGSYLNFSELLDGANLRAITRRAAECSYPIKSAMTADINGYSWGFAQALLENGIGNLFTCIHTHHGMYPLGRQQAGFWWESQSGEKLLVWSGEHYHFGNELGLSPGAGASYLTKDECNAEEVYTDWWKLAETRIPRYLAKLDREQYSFDVVPLMISGLRTDNGPPNPRIAEAVDRWNTEHEDICRIQMATLDEFFTSLRSQVDLLPTYRGDWPDWWTDGTASYPAGTRLFRQAQRDLGRYRALCRSHPEVREADPGGVREKAVLDHLAMYAEHTFSHQDSVSRPGHFMVQTIAGVKQARAALAVDEGVGLLDGAATVLGEAGLTAGTPPRFKVVNPWPQALSTLVRLTVGHHEFYELGMNTGVTIRDEGSGQTLPWWRDSVPRGEDYVVRLDLAAGQERIIQLEPGQEKATWPPEEPKISSNELKTRPQKSTSLENDHFLIEWDAKEGITTWQEKSCGSSILRPDKPYPPFTLIHEVSPVESAGQMGQVRGSMGLNRKSHDVVRTAAALGQARLLEGGPHYRGVEFNITAPGISHGLLALTILNDSPRVEARLKFLKHANWEPENLYLALPFQAGSESQVWLDKCGGLMRPRRDQIPGTLTDYYSVQKGLLWSGSNGAVLVSSPDGNLIQLGPLEHGERLLMGDQRLEKDPAHVFAWLMTNYWETNFGAQLGGFHEFRFAVETRTEKMNVESLGKQFRGLDREPVCIRLPHQ